MGRLVDLFTRESCSHKGSKDEVSNLTMMSSRSNTAVFFLPPPSPLSKSETVMTEQIPPVTCFMDCHTFYLLLVIGIRIQIHSVDLGDGACGI